jgi:hypothetical protein
MKENEQCNDEGSSWRSVYLKALWEYTKSIMQGTGYGELRIVIHNGKIKQILPTQSIDFERNLVEPMGLTVNQS